MKKIRPSSSAISAVIGILLLCFTPALMAGQKNHPTTHGPKSTSSPTPASSSTPPHFVARIEHNPQLLTRLQPLLPSGMTLTDAAQGFKREGQFIAALHVSHNLNIPFAQLKTEMTGKDHDSLGQAIHDLQPGADAKAAAKNAEAEARADIKATRPAKINNDQDDKDKGKDKDDHR